MNRELNLVPQIFDHETVSKKKKTNTILGLLGIVLVIVLSFGYTIGKEMYLGIKEKKLQSEVALNKDLILKEQELEENITRTKDHIEKAGTLSSIKSKKTDEIFIKLQEKFPASIKLTNLNYNKLGFTATGSSASKDDIEVLWANLRESEEFKNSYITSIKHDEKTASFTFILEVTLGAGGENNEAK